MINMAKNTGAGTGTGTGKAKLTTVAGGKGKANNTEKGANEVKDQVKNPASTNENENPAGAPATEGATDGDKKGGASLATLPDDEFDKGKRDGNADEDKGGEGQLALDENGGVKVDPDAPKDGENPMLKDSDKKEVAPFVRTTKMDKQKKDVTIKSLFKEWKKDQLLLAERLKAEKIAAEKGEELPAWEDPRTMRFDLAIQRNEVWNDIQKSDLIHTILYGYYVPNVLVEDKNDGKKWFLDGKQRITTIMSFINGDWALSKKTEDVCGFKIAGFKFKDLPEDMQDEIMGETITLVVMKNMTDAERDKLFVKLNSGSPLSRIELTRAKHSELIEGVNELSNLHFFKEDLELSKKARNRFVDQEIILQIAMLFEEGAEKIKGFGAAQIEDYVLRLKASDKVLSDEMVKRIENISTYLTEAFEEFEMDDIQKALKKIHVPIIFKVAEDVAMKQAIAPKMFGNFVRSFLISNYSVSSAYGKSCQAGSSKKESVLTRIQEMTKSANEFVEMVKNAASPEEGFQAFDLKLAEENGIDRTQESEEESA